MLIISAQDPIMIISLSAKLLRLALNDIKNLPTLDEVLCYKNWEIKTSTGDGHCLLYSIVTSWNSQSFLPPIDLHELKCKFFVEAIRNYDIYSAFMITPNQNSYFTQMRKYIVDKMYDNDIVDVAPVILSTALMAKIDILHITSSYVEKNSCFPIVYRHRKYHHSGRKWRSLQWANCSE